MFTDRTVHILICCVTTVFVGLTLAPQDAESCSPQPTSDHLPTHGEVIPPDASIYVVSVNPSWWQGVAPAIENSVGDLHYLPLPSELTNLGEVAPDHKLFMYEPEPSLAPGTYTFHGAHNASDQTPTSTFSVSEDVVYDPPDAISELEWNTRVFGSMQQPRTTCLHEFRQESHLVFPRVEPKGSRSLLYTLTFTADDNFDGESDRPRRFSRTAVVVDTPAGPDFDDRPFYLFGEVTDDSIIAEVSVPFRAECVEVTVSDLTGQQSETFEQCMPNHCAPAPSGNIWEDQRLWFENIDWSAQPDCSQEYCFTDDCEPSGEPDAGATPADAGPDASDAAFGDADAGDDAADAKSQAQVDVANTADAHSDGSSSTPDDSTVASESCSTTTVERPNQVPLSALALAGFFGAGWFFRRRLLRCECF